MDNFNYRSGTLYVEDVSVADIAARVGTPFYCYSTATLERHYRVFSEAFDVLGKGRATICYSVKSNSNIAVIGTLARLGAGADIVSEGEFLRARAAGITPDKIVFSGVGKTADEMRLTLEADILQFNVESEEELILLNDIATDMGKVAAVALRVNPDVDAGTHEKISTGRKENKFGIAWSRACETYALAARLPGISVEGVDVHIGSQLTSLAPFEAAFTKVAGLVNELRAAGHIIKRVDLGGGLGIPYQRHNLRDGHNIIGGDENNPAAPTEPPSPKDYANLVARVIGPLDCDVVLEPGRLLVGNAGILVSSVIRVKQGENRRFVILDAAMNDLLRPSLYDAWHDIEPVQQAAPDAELIPLDFVGPVCETGDTFAVARMMPPVTADDLVAIRSAGAYGAVMSSTYNTRPLIPEVLVNEDQFDIIRRRPGVQEMLDLDIIPDRLGL